MTEPVERERDYLERTIETVRNHRDADNCWPQWANIFADEIERLWKAEEDREQRGAPDDRWVERANRAVPCSERPGIYEGPGDHLT